MKLSLPVRQLLLVELILEEGRVRLGQQLDRIDRTQRAHQRRRLVRVAAVTTQASVGGSHVSAGWCRGGEGVLLEGIGRRRCRIGWVVCLRKNIY